MSQHRTLPCVIAIIWALLAGCGASHARATPHPVVSATSTLIALSSATPSTASPTVGASPASDGCPTSLALAGMQSHGVPLPVALYGQDPAEQSVNHFAGIVCGAAYFAFFQQALGPAGWTITAADQQTPQQFVLRCQRGLDRLTITIVDYPDGNGAYVVLASDG